MTPVERPRLRSPAVVAIAVILVLAVAGWLAIGSPIFRVDGIVVRGARHLEPDEVRSTARVPGDANLLRVSLEAIAARLERDPWVAAAVVSRDLPSTLVITIRERRAGGWLETGGAVAVVAGDGTVLERRDRPPRTLPELRGTPVDGDPEAVPASLRVTGSMPERLLARARVAAARGEEVVVGLRGGGEVRYGRPSQLREKHRAVLSVLGWAEEHGIVIAEIDVRAPSAPTLRAPDGPVEVPAEPPPTPLD